MVNELVSNIFIYHSLSFIDEMMMMRFRQKNFYAQKLIRLHHRFVWQIKQGLLLLVFPSIFDFNFLYDPKNLIPIDKRNKTGRIIKEFI